LEWSLNDGAVQEGVRLAASIGLFWFYERRCSLNDFWMTRALEHREVVSREVRAQLLLTAGWAAWSVLEMERARQLILQALDVFRELEDTLWIGRTLVSLASTAMGYPELYAQARAWLDEASAIADQIKDNYLEVTILTVLGEVARSIGDYATAKKAYEGSLKLSRQAEDRYEERQALVNNSYVYSHDGDYKSAFDFARQALQLSLEIHSIPAIIATLEVLAHVIGPLGQPERAVRLYGIAEAFREKRGGRIEAGDLADYEEGLAKVRTMLDSTKFNALWAEGQAMDLDQAIAYALDEFGYNLDSKLQAG